MKRELEQVARKYGTSLANVVGTIIASHAGQLGELYRAAQVQHLTGE